MTTHPQPEFRGRWSRRSEREAAAAARNAHVAHLHARVVAGEIALEDVAPDLRLDVRFHAALRAWEKRGLAVEVIWPHGHVDTLAGACPDPLLAPDARVRFADPGNETVDGEGLDEWLWAAFLAPVDDPGTPHPSASADSAGASDIVNEAEREMGTRHAGWGMGVSADEAPLMVWREPRLSLHRLAAIWPAPAPLPEHGRTKIAVGRDGTVYQSLSARGEIRVFSRDGALLRRWGRHAGTRLKHPLGIAVDADGDLLIADRFLGKVLKCAPDGRQVGEWSGLYTTHFPASESSPAEVIVEDLDAIDVAVSRDGGTIVTNELGFNQVIWLAPDGEMNGSLTIWDTIAMAPTGDGSRVYLLRDRGRWLAWHSADDEADWEAPDDQACYRFEDLDVAPDDTLYAVSERASEVVWLNDDGAVLDVATVGEVVQGIDPHRPFGALFTAQVDRTHPTGLAVDPAASPVRVYVTFNDGMIAVLERTSH